jgi:hypothetical protein
MFLWLVWCALFGPFPRELGPPTVGIVLRWEKKPAEAFVRLLRSEVEHIFRPAGLVLRWEVGQKKRVGSYDRVVVVTLRGNCSEHRIYDFPEGSLVNGSPLGWTYVNDGELIPHSALDCDQIARALAEMRGRLPHQLTVRNVHVRLAARVLAHEMMHVLLRTRDHDAADFTSPTLRLEDLQKGLRLRSEQISALRRIGRGAPGVSLAETRR